MARFGMKQKKERGSSLHLSPGFLWQSSEGHDATVEQNQAVCTRQSAQEVTFSPRASAAVAAASCHLQMVSSGLSQEGELKKMHGPEGLLPWATQYNQGRFPWEGETSQKADRTCSSYSQGRMILWLPSHPQAGAGWIVQVLELPTRNWSNTERETEIWASCQRLCPACCQHLAKLESQLLPLLPEVAQSASTEPIHLPVV